MNNEHVMNTRVFLKRHFERKQKTQPSTQLGGDLGRIYPEGEDDRTSLGGPPRHLKFRKIDSESAAA